MQIVSRGGQSKQDRAFFEKSAAKNYFKLGRRRENGRRVRKKGPGRLPRAIFDALADRLIAGILAAVLVNARKLGVVGLLDLLGDGGRIGGQRGGEGQGENESGDGFHGTNSLRILLRNGFVAMKRYVDPCFEIWNVRRS
jgi:hypothetical protein